VSFLNEGIVSTDQLRVSAGDLKNDFALNMATVGSEMSEMQQNCVALQGRARLTSATRLRLASACSAFADGYKQYGDKFRPVAEGLSRLDTIYEREAQNQRQILDEAMRLQNNG